MASSFLLDAQKGFESVTIMFTELMNIDEMTAVNAFQAVSCMNSVFSCFDNIVDRHNVYKVRYFTPTVCWKLLYW